MCEFFWTNNFDDRLARGAWLDYLVSGRDGARNARCRESFEATGGYKNKSRRDIRAAAAAAFLTFPHASIRLDILCTLPLAFIYFIDKQYFFLTHLSTLFVHNDFIINYHFPISFCTFRESGEIDKAFLRQSQYCKKLAISDRIYLLSNNFVTEPCLF